MKRFWAAALFTLMIVSFLTACATTAGDKRGSGGKKSTPQQAQEEVVGAGNTPQPTKAR